MLIQKVKTIGIALVVLLALSGCSGAGTAEEGNISPTQISDLGIDSTTGGNIKVSWVPPSDPDSVESYRLRATNTATDEMQIVVVLAAGVIMEGDRAVANIPIRNGKWLVEVIVVKTDNSFEEPETAKDIADINNWPATPPDGVSNIVASATHNAITLNWSSPESLGTDNTGSLASIISYTIYLEAGSEIALTTTGIIDVSDTTAVITNRDPKTTYSYAIQAKNSAGQMSMSSTQSITTEAAN